MAQPRGPSTSLNPLAPLLYGTLTHLHHGRTNMALLHSQCANARNMSLRRESSQEPPRATRTTQTLWRVHAATGARCAAGGLPPQPCTSPAPPLSNPCHGCGKTVWRRSVAGPPRAFRCGKDQLGQLSHDVRRAPTAWERAGRHASGGAAGWALGAWRAGATWKMM